MVRRFADGAFALLPGALLVYLAFNAGGYFANTQGLVAVVLLILLAGWLLFAAEPLAGLGWPLGAAIGALAAYAGWTLLSADWSDSTSRALLEFNRALLYLVALALFGLTIRRTWQVQWLVWGLAGAIIAVCAVALTTRLLPDAWPIGSNLAEDRLSYPITYWNALGLLASLGIVFCLQTTTRARGPKLIRVLGAAAIPLLATTVYFTFSRGAVATGAVGVIACLVLARARGTVSGLIAVLPPTAIALVVAYDANLLATDRPTTAAAAGQGDHVAWVLGGCIVGAALARAALLLLDSRLARPRRLVRPELARGAVAVALVVAVALPLALGAPGWIGRQYDRFTGNSPVSEGAPDSGEPDLRERLTSVSSNGRLDYWGIALDEFERSRLEGQGAGTFQIAWNRERDIPAPVVDAHGLYPEVLGELGLVGLVLLVATLVAVMAGFAAGLRGSHRTLYAGLFAAGLTWILAAAVDWHWEMPVVTLWLFAAGGAALARRTSSTVLSRPAIIVRVGLALPLLLLAILPYKVYDSQAWLDRADNAYGRGNCPLSSEDAHSSLSALGSRPEPYEVLGYCAIRSGRLGAAVDYMQSAVDRDPRNWNFRYGLALAQASAGLDPRPEARRAKRLDPLGPLAKGAVRAFATGSPGDWRRRARALARRLNSL